ncbi:MAG TPA: hypothetical protein VGF80_09685 [Galbitalea sp.]|jgi:hypothetical protein
MIIWSWWGIFVLLFVGAGVGIGFAIGAAFGALRDTGSQNGVFVGIGFVVSSVGLWFFNKYVVDRHLDKPRQSVVYQPLAEPVKHPNGSTQTHVAVPVLHPTTGEPLWTKPRSTFFFVPVRYWPFVLGALGVIVFLINLIVVLAGGK